MTSQQLKNSILQMAVQGLLVPQDPNDEPASVLLQRIREEKQKLVKEGKIKKDKHSSVIFRGSDNLPYESRDNSTPVCIAEQIPFEIPESWEWARLGEVGNTNIGLTYKPQDVSQTDGTIVLRSNNIQKDKICYQNIIKVKSSVPERALIHKGDLLICARNGSRALVGKSAIVDKDGMAFGAFMAKFSSPFNKYIHVFLNSNYFRSQLEGVGTETINQLTQERLRSQLIPIPPLAEQRRIVAKLEELLPLVEEYGKAESTLTTLNATFPDALKKSILQDAVQGKLVPQDPDDEPASVLLERIRREKKALDKTKKGKRNPVESRIVRRDNSYYELRDGVERCIDEFLPFDIPESWEWARLGDVGILSTGNTPSRQ
ncbi:MAG: restriction endonuclease subunit S, partial [Planctomycetia bacterium]|nr:restriction endonuclease subunit S [Planctomycetia bacterium]